MTDSSLSAERAVENAKHRAAMIGGLRTLIDWLDTHPTVPVPTSVRMQATVLDGGEAARTAEVERFAELIGVPVIRETFDVKAYVQIGPVVEYVVYAMTDEGRRVLVSRPS